MLRLPRDILERVERVMEYHRASKLTPQSVRANPMALDLPIKPALYRQFEGLAKAALPTSVLDAPVSAAAVLSEGLNAVPDSQRNPPQNLKTLASWLYLANGLAVQTEATRMAPWLRTCPSSGALYPYEIYVAAFGIEGLEPGLYHYSVKEFALRKMRDGAITLATIKRGRPDLNFLKSVPAALLVSTIFWRSAWRYRARGYRIALLDAGHVIENLVAAGNGLGVQTMTRLQINDSTTRELIGLAPDADFGAAEAVQAMVIWADDATCPLPESAALSPRGGLAPIARSPLSPKYVPYGSIVAIHQDCVAPGMPVRVIRPPLTELSPMAPTSLSPAPAYAQAPQSRTIRQALLSRRSTRVFSDNSISRDQFLAINRLAFRGGTVLPMQPDGPHIALLRPFWVLHAVAGLDAGAWYYDPKGDRLAMVRRGNYRPDTQFLNVEQSLCGQAAAICFLVADLHTLTAGAGPDAYRLAHLEAGIAGQRVCLAAAAISLGCCGIGVFYDDPVRNFLMLDNTGWETIYALAIGIAS
ncbi:MAG TPA: SagB/ThcOx family dehydrogenase [Tepidisphaeraceae bacterium]|nr:SagB/ThcOx family dehydrogenase [Tepidisphaeraceae bacterium]